jgi:nucleotide-binding universal stress UspA family protein
VLTVPPHLSRLTLSPFARVLCAVDFSEASLRAMECAMSSPLTTGARFILAHVADWTTLDTPPIRFEELSLEEDEALKHLRDRREDAACRRLRALIPENLRERCSMVMGRGPGGAELARLAADQQADLVVVGLRGHGAMGLPAFGSTAHYLIRTLTVPVLSLA